MGCVDPPGRKKTECDLPLKGLAISSETTPPRPGWDAHRMADLVLEDFIRDVPDFPRPGIVFKDITPLLQDPGAFAETLARMAEQVSGAAFDLVCGIESRGFLFGAALAKELGKGFIPIRKPGKLPWRTASESYELEYGNDTIEIHVDATPGGKRVLMVDDLLATGGTMGAALKLVRKVGGDPVACAFVIELAFLKGRQQLGQVPVHALVQY
jgi:adenine phosphoribosyltransferase